METEKIGKLDAISVALIKTLDLLCATLEKKPYKVTSAR